MLYRGLLVGVLVLVVASSLVGEPPQKAKLEPQKVLRVAADRLYFSYDTNLAAADRKYLDKAIEITGVSVDLRKDDKGKYYVVGAAHGRRVKPAHRGPRPRTNAEIAKAIDDENAGVWDRPGVYLFVPAGNRDKFADAPPGHTIVVRGICRGMTKDDKTSPDYFVHVDNCELIEIEKGDDR